MDRASGSSTRVDARRASGRHAPTAIGRSPPTSRGASSARSTISPKQTGTHRSCSRHGRDRVRSCSRTHASCRGPSVARPASSSMTRAQAAWCCQRCSGCGGSGATPISGRTSSTPSAPSARCWSRKARRRERCSTAVRTFIGGGADSVSCRAQAPWARSGIRTSSPTFSCGSSPRTRGEAPSTSASMPSRRQVRSSPERARSPARHGPRDVVASRVAGVVLLTSLVHHRRRPARDAARAVRRGRAGAVVVDRAVARRACARSQTEPCRHERALPRPRRRLCDRRRRL